MARRGTKGRPSLKASAQRIRLNAGASAIRRSMGTRTQDQEEAWAYYDSVPELKHAVNFTSSQLAKLRLFAAAAPTPDHPTPIPVTDESSPVSPALAAAAQEELDALRSDLGGQSEVLRVLTAGLEVAGEAFLVGFGPRDEVVNPRTGEVAEPAVDQQWQVFSTSEVKVNQSTGAVTIRPDGRQAGARKLDPDAGDEIIRVWLRHPRWGGRADSAVLGLLGVCRILEALGQEELAVTQSRLFAGVFKIPNGLLTGTPPPAAGEDKRHPLIAALDDAYRIPLDDPETMDTVRPVFVRGDREDLASDVFGFVDVARSRDDAIAEKLDKWVRRFARGISLPVEVVEGLESCVDHETECLTGRGWLTYDQVRPGDELLTLNHETGMSEWHRASDVSVFPVTDRSMVEMTGRSHSSLTTGNHNWPVITQRGKRRWRFSEDMNTGVRLIHAAPAADLPTDPKWLDAFVELVAWVYTEGHLRAGEGGEVSQSSTANPSHCVEIRRALTDLFGPPEESLHKTARARGLDACSFPDCGWPVHGNGLCDAHRYQARQGKGLRPVRRQTPPPPNPDLTRPAWTEAQSGEMTRFRFNQQVGDLLRAVMTADEKVVSSEFIRSLTAAQLELFIRRSVDGDGHHRKDGTFEFHQVVRDRTDALMLACVLAGRGVSYAQRPGTKPGSGDRHILRTRRPIPMRVGFGIRHEEATYSGVVWCPTVQNGTWLARRRGSVYFTGNTTFANAAQVDQDTFDDYLQPRVVLIVDALTVGYLRPKLYARGFAAEEIERVVVHFDPAPLIARPDKAKAADRGVELGTLSGAAWREVFEFGDDDAPDAAEMLERLATRRGVASSSVTVAILESLLADEAGVTFPDRDELIEEAQADASSVITAASTRTSDLGDRLARIDMRAMDRVSQAASDAMDRALERAGNVLRSRLPGELRKLARSVDPRLVAATVGESAVTAAASDEDLFGTSWDGLRTTFYAAAADGQAEARRSAARDVPIDEESLAAAQEEDTDEAWVWMAAAMTGVARERLYHPVVEVRGEADVLHTAPQGLTRQGLTRAGGTEGLVMRGASDGWVVTRADGSPAGGVATGERMTAALRDGGASTGRWSWLYGGSSNSFEPHLALDGTRFDTYDDPQLVNGSGWPPFDFYFPGDHNGCSCVAVPAIDLPDT